MYLARQSPICWEMNKKQLKRLDAVDELGLVLDDLDHLDGQQRHLEPFTEDCYTRYVPVTQGHHLVALTLVEHVPPLFQLLRPSGIARDKSTACDADEPLLC